MNRLFLFFVLLTCFSFVRAQSLVNTGEEILFKCQLDRGQVLVLVHDSINNYMKCRLGDGDFLEFDFPDTLENSFDQFRYEYYLRGGGVENEGLDLNYVYFSKKNQRLTIYEEYSAVDDMETCGLIITDLRNGESSEFPGVEPVLEGSLSVFRYNGLLETSD